MMSRELDSDFAWWAPHRERILDLIGVLERDLLFDGEISSADDEEFHASADEGLGASTETGLLQSFEGDFSCAKSSQVGLSLLVTLS